MRISDWSSDVCSSDLRRLEDSEIQPRRQEVVLNVALDLMLDEVGGDGMEHRAEDKVCDARFFRRINHLEPHLALARMSGRADMVYLVHAQHSPGDNLRLRDIADDYVSDSLGSKHLRGLRRARAGAEWYACLQQSWHQQSALITICGSQ